MLKPTPPRIIRCSSYIGPSFNGRTQLSKSCYGGSNPSGPADLRYNDFMKKSQRTAAIKGLWWGAIFIIVFIVIAYKSGLVESYCATRVRALPLEVAAETIYPQDFPKNISFNENINWMTRSRLETIKCENNPLMYSLKR